MYAFCDPLVTVGGTAQRVLVASIANPAESYVSIPCITQGWAEGASRAAAKAPRGKKARTDRSPPRGGSGLGERAGSGSSGGESSTATDDPSKADETFHWSRALLVFFSEDLREVYSEIPLAAFLRRRMRITSLQDCTLLCYRLNKKRAAESESGARDGSHGAPFDEAFAELLRRGGMEPEARRQSDATLQQQPLFSPPDSLPREGLFITAPSVAERELFLYHFEDALRQAMHWRAGGGDVGGGRSCGRSCGGCRAIEDDEEGERRRRGASRGSKSYREPRQDPGTVHAPLEEARHASPPQITAMGRSLPSPGGTLAADHPETVTTAALRARLVERDQYISRLLEEHDMRRAAFHQKMCAVNNGGGARGARGTAASAHRMIGDVQGGRAGGAMLSLDRAPADLQRELNSEAMRARSMRRDSLFRAQLALHSAADGSDAHRVDDGHSAFRLHPLSGENGASHSPQARPPPAPADDVHEGRRSAMPSFSGWLEERQASRGGAQTPTVKPAVVVDHCLGDGGSGEMHVATWDAADGVGRRPPIPALRERAKLLDDLKQAVAAFDALSPPTTSSDGAELLVGPTKRRLLELHREELWKMQYGLPHESTAVPSAATGDSPPPGLPTRPLSGIESPPDEFESVEAIQKALETEKKLLNSLRSSAKASARPLPFSFTESSPLASAHAQFTPLSPPLQAGEPKGPPPAPHPMASLPPQQQQHQQQHPQPAVFGSKPTLITSAAISKPASFSEPPSPTNDTAPASSSPTVVLESVEPMPRDVAPAAQPPPASKAPPPAQPPSKLPPPPMSKAPPPPATPASKLPVPPTSKAPPPPSKVPPPQASKLPPQLASKAAPSPAVPPAGSMVSDSVATAADSAAIDAPSPVVDDVEKKAIPAAAKVDASPACGSDWRAVSDPSTGKTYFVHKETKKTTWKIEETHVSTASPASPPLNTELKAKPSGLWVAKLDATLGKTYYYHKKTKQTTWKRSDTDLGPEEGGNGAAIATEEVASKKKKVKKVEGEGAADSSTPLPAGWKAVNDPTSGKQYYVNKATKETTWTRPKA